MATKTKVRPKTKVVAKQAPDEQVVEESTAQKSDNNGGTVTKVFETKVDINGVEKYKCQYCGKWVTTETSIENEAGHYCEQLRERGLDTLTLAEIKASKTVAELEGGEQAWVKTAVLHRLCNKHDIPVSRMVKAFGGDRGIESVARPEFQFVYCGRARYVRAWCATKEGLDFLKGYNPRKKDAITEALTG